MKLIESKAELLQQQKGIDGIYKQIELCGRTCYKSTDKITDDSARPFVTRMIASKHTAMLEQGTVYLIIKWWHIIKFFKYLFNPYSKVHRYRYVTTNLRVITEKKWDKDLEYICEPTKYHEKRYTMKFTTDRGVSHELVRHRVFSFAQESTRYCNYSKDKFGKELTFVKPAWDITLGSDQYGEDRSLPFFLNEVETLYNRLINSHQWTPQQARMVLPNCLKTEICMTGFASDWRFFFDLRYYGETGKPHPDMELIASKAREEFIKAGLWDDIMSHSTTFNDGKSN